MTENLKNKLDDIDFMIRKIINKYVSKENLTFDKPLSLNVLFSEDYEDNFIDDIEFFYEDKEKVKLTLYIPYSINKLRFDVLSDKKISIRSNDFSFYKQFWFTCPVVKETMKPTYKNNVLEISFLKKNGPTQI